MQIIQINGWRSSAVLLLLVLVCTSQMVQVPAKSIVGKVVDQAEEAFDDFLSEDQPSARPIKSLLKPPPLIIGPKSGNQPSSGKRVDAQHSGQQGTISKQTGWYQSGDPELLSSALTGGDLANQISASSARDLKDWPIIKKLSTYVPQVFDFIRNIFGSSSSQAAKTDPGAPSVQIIFQGVGSESHVSATGCPGSTC